MLLGGITSTPTTRKNDIGEVRLGEESLVVTLPAHGSVQGRVTDADTGSPIADVHVKVLLGPPDEPSCQTNSDGDFSFPRVPVGTWTLDVGPEGHYWGREKEIEVVEGWDAYVEIKLWSYWTIRGRLLLGDTGEPVATEIRTKDGNYVSKRDGRFVIPVPTTSSRFWEYLISVPLEGTGFKAVEKIVYYDGQVREVDIGDIYIQREVPESKEAGEDKSGTIP